MILGWVAEDLLYGCWRMPARWLGVQEIGRVLGGVFGVHGRFHFEPLDFHDIKEEVDSWW